MRYLTDRLFVLVRASSQGSGDGLPNETGWGTAVVLILASSLGLASLAWLLVDRLVN
jgi:hypothetical protein